MSVGAGAVCEKIDIVSSIRTQKDKSKYIIHFYLIPDLSLWADAVTLTKLSGTPFQTHAEICLTHDSKARLMMKNDRPNP